MNDRIVVERTCLFQVLWNWISNFTKDQWIKFFYLSILLSVPIAGNCGCVLDCLLSPGTKCVNNECVPIVSPSPTPVATKSEARILMKPANEAVCVVIDCTGMDMKNFKVFAVRRIPPPSASFYSCIFYFETDFQVYYFFARKDILNRYRFIPLAYNEKPHPQHEGLDFVYNVWENPAFNDFIQNKTCAELKTSGVYFNCGISIKGDTSDFEPRSASSDIRRVVALAGMISGFSERGVVGTTAGGCFAMMLTSVKGRGRIDPH